MVMHMPNKKIKLLTNKQFVNKLLTDNIKLNPIYHIKKLVASGYLLMIQEYLNLNN